MSLGVGLCMIKVLEACVPINTLSKNTFGIAVKGANDNIGTSSI